jgi:hypothetical protein
MQDGMVYDNDVFGLFEEDPDDQIRSKQVLNNDEPTKYSQQLLLLLLLRTSLDDNEVIFLHKKKIVPDLNNTNGSYYGC